MPKIPGFNATARARVVAQCGAIRPLVAGIILVSVCAVGGLIAYFASDEISASGSYSAVAAPTGPGEKVNAAWYKVPPDSLAAERAHGHEYTAAHNKLPLGTLVRVTNAKNQKSVDVRITDRGIRNRRVKIDLCKEAAAELGIVSEGIARVRMQVLSAPTGGSPASADAATP